MKEQDGVDAQRELDDTRPALKNEFRDRIQEEGANESAPPQDVANESRGRVLVRGGRRPGKLIAPPDAAPLVRPAAPVKPPEVRFLRPGDRVRALGVVYVVRKVTKKDVVMRPVKDVGEDGS